MTLGEVYIDMSSVRSNHVYVTAAFRKILANLVHVQVRVSQKKRTFRMLLEPH